MKITKINILAALDAVKSVANKRTTYPVVNCVRLASDGQQLSVRATDLEQDETRLAPCEGRLMPVLVSAAKFHDLLQFAKDDIELEIDKGHLIVTSNGVTKLGIQDVDQFPALPDDKFKAVGISTSDLAEGISAVAWARRMIEDTQVFQSVHVVSGPAELLCEATNRNTVAAWRRASIGGESNFMIPTAYIERFKGLLEMPGATVHLGEKHLMIKHDSGEYYCRQVEGVYPNVQGFFTGKKTAVMGRLEIDPVFEAARTCMLLSADEWAHGLMSFSKEGIEIEFQSPTDSHSVKIPGKFKELEARINFSTFADCLKAFPDDVIDFVTLGIDGKTMPPVLMFKNTELKVLTTQVSDIKAAYQNPATAPAEAVPA